MKLLISEGDWIYRQRIVELQTRIAGSKVLIEEPDAPSIISTIQRSNPNVVILGTQMTQSSVLEILEYVQIMLSLLTRLIIIRDKPHDELHEIFNSYHATFIDNTARGFNKLILILQKIQVELDQDQVVFARKKDMRRRKNLIWSRNPGELLQKWR